jgi:hypothetical protein
MRHSFIFFILVLLGFAACNQKSPKTSSLSLNPILVDSITTVAQKTLGGTLMKQVATNGAVAALEFCNLEALPITDSVASTYNVVIQRISEKNRNPKNALNSQLDIQIWEAYLNNEANGIIQKTDESGKTVFYKPIKMAMETCLNCHGNIETIKPQVAEKIKELYPNDKATGFSMNDLRGMWKVTQN